MEIVINSKGGETNLRLIMSSLTVIEKILITDSKNENQIQTD